jgi:hypothetical protein
MQTDVIYVQKRNNRFWVWMGSDKEPNPKPAKCDAKFYEFRDAWKYAVDWQDHVQSVCSVRRLFAATL